MGKLVKVASAAEIPPGSAKLVEVEGKRIAVFNVGGPYHANRRIRFPFRGEDGAVSFYLEKARGRRPKGEASVPKKRGRPRKGQ